MITVFVYILFGIVAVAILDLSTRRMRFTHKQNIRAAKARYNEQSALQWENRERLRRLRNPDPTNEIRTIDYDN
jgi:hypothetical protein